MTIPTNSSVGARLALDVARRLGEAKVAKARARAWRRAQKAAGAKAARKKAERPCRWTSRTHSSSSLTIARTVSGVVPAPKGGKATKAVLEHRLLSASPLSLYARRFDLRSSSRAKRNIRRGAQKPQRRNPRGAVCQAARLHARFAFDQELRLGRSLRREGQACDLRPRVSGISASFENARAGYRQGDEKQARLTPPRQSDSWRFSTALNTVAGTCRRSSSL